MTLKNKVIWVTGASSGIGKYLAVELSQHDTKLIISSRNRDHLEEAKQLCKTPNNVKILPLDLEKHDELTEITNEAISFFGKIDILVNNGGISQRALAKNTSLNVDKRIISINYLGTITLTKAVLPHFINNKSGQFVVTTSIVGKIGTPLRSSYAASKHALHGFFDSLRAEVYKDNIFVTLVCPGYVKTNVSINALTGNGKSQQTMDKTTENGLKPEYFAKLMVKAISNKKQEVYFAGFKEKLAVYAKRFFPKLLAKMLTKISVT